ncbi:agglutinin cell wall attachment protein [Leucobacter denitrificans]|uniref:Agglutinin cell wall attachment protein n=1 Tax=Leucobacter denitrificans TaxID=683042 RepID=A0A7G9S7U0_9MICO|nr:agglutinin cell wall attachment protein [Leucobacter denitrificans]
MEVPPMIRQGQLIDEIAPRLPDRVEGAWSRLYFRHRNLSKLSGGRIEVVRPDTTEGYALPPRDILPLIDELRKVMYRPGVGTWFSAVWTLTKDASGEVSADVSFNYDDEPEWSDPIHPGLYGIDLEDFPRDEEHIPVWLQERLAEARKNASEAQ